MNYVTSIKGQTFGADNTLENLYKVKSGIYKLGPSTSPDWINNINSNLYGHILILNNNQNNIYGSVSFLILGHDSKAYTGYVDGFSREELNVKINSVSLTKLV